MWRVRVEGPAEGSGRTETEAESEGEVNSWRCASCGCAFPDHPYPEQLCQGVPGERCTKCVEVEVRRLRKLNEGLAERVAAQSALLSKRAEKT